MTDTLKDIISKNRPNVSISSINTYLTNIRSTASKIGIPIKTVNDIIDNSTKIFESMNDLKTNTRKSKLASFIVALDNKDNTKKVDDILIKFREQMNKDLSTIRDKDTAQELTEEQKANFVPWNQVLNLYKILTVEAQPLLSLKTLTAKQFQKLTDYILMGLYTEIPPRRSLDYTAFKIKNIDEKNDNYLQVKKGKYKIVFNKYKNSSRLGSQVIDIPPTFGKTLKKFIDKNPYDYLIVNNLGKPVLQNHITKILNRLFDKQVSSSLLRHSFLTHKFGDVDLQELEKTTEAMGNSKDSLNRTFAYVSKEEAGKERMGNNSLKK